MQTRTIARNRVVLAFRDPYGQPLTRQELALVLGGPTSPEPSRALQNLWGQLWMLMLAKENDWKASIARKDHAVAKAIWPRFGKYRLDDLTRFEILSDEFHATWANLLVGLWKARLWFDRFPGQVDWIAVVDQWLAERGCYRISGLKRKGGTDDRYDARWIFSKPKDLALLRQEALGCHTDFESFASYILKGIDDRAGTRACRWCKERGLHVPLDEKRGRRKGQKTPDEE